MKRIIHIAILILLLYIKGNSQEISAGLQSGIGTYSMRDLKNINEIIIRELPFDTKTVANFPPFLYYSAVIKKQIRNVNLGIVYSFQSTGSRISGRDYSGEYRFDMIINSSAPGIYDEFILPSQGKAQFSFFSIFGVLFSKLKIDEFLTVLDNNVTDDTYRYKALNYYLEPGFSFSYPIKFLKIGINTGYLIQLRNRSFYSVENKNYMLLNPQSGDLVRPGWNGIRAGLSVIYTFPGKGQ
jgi:hypothetical protein